MSKYIFLFVGLLGLAIIGTGAYFGIKSLEPTSLTEADTADVSAEINPELREVVITVEPEQPESDQEIDIDESSYFDGRPPFFKDMEISLSGDLPVTAGEGTIWKVEFGDTSSEDEMLSIGRQFGFEGDLYKQEAPADMLNEIARIDDDAVASEMMMYLGYMMIDGSRSLSFRGTSVNYLDSAYGEPWLVASNKNDLSFEERQSIAESWLLERDLLPDNWVSENASHGPFIVFYEMVDGMKLDMSIANVGITPEGQVVIVDYQSRLTLESVEKQPLISADTAWQQLAADPGKYQFDFMVDEFEQLNYYQPQMWKRSYAPDEQVSKPVWVERYTAVGSGTPLIRAENHILLNGSPETIDAIMQLESDAIIITGTTSTESGSARFNVTEFSEQGEVFNDPTYFTGTIERSADGIVYLIVSGGLRVELPGVPTEVEDGMKVQVYGFSISDAAEGAPVFDWASIEQRNDEQQFEEPMWPDPMTTKSFDVTDVELEWLPAYRFQINEPYFDSYSPEYGLMLDSLFIPSWTFSGTTDTDAELEFYVPAIDLENIDLYQTDTP